MSMNSLTINFLDLPDEILLTIFKKLSNTDLLYSLVGLNQALDKVVCDIKFTRIVDLTIVSSNEASELRSSAMLDRFYTYVLPRIRHNLESLTLQAEFLNRIHAGIYPNLHKLTLVNLEISMASVIFKSMSIDFSRFKS